MTTTGNALAQDVLRYWLSVLQHEEALAARPRARRLEGSSFERIHVRDPAGGQQYAKLPTQGAEALLIDGVGHVERELQGDWGPFFEDWLLARYRRGDTEDGGASELAMFPAVHLPRDELAGLLRVPLDLSWLSAGARFEVPTVAKRRQGMYPEPPTYVRLAVASRPSDDTLPFYLDGYLLREVLRVDAQGIDALFACLRERSELTPREMVWAVARVIDRQVVLERGSAVDRSDSVETELASLSFPDVLPEPRALMNQLTAAVGERLKQLRAAARVYDVSLVVGAQTRTTWHLQRDIQAALDAHEANELDAQSPLGLYLGGGRATTKRTVCLGRFTEHGLTPGQQDVCELALGSTLTAAQGPPGTGKTRLILNLFAHALVDRVGIYARTGRMGHKLAMVASTNNRAVDNAVDPLSAELPEGALPLALRVGSRQTIEKVTLPQLERCLRWLLRREPPPEQAKEALEQALRAFRAQWQSLDQTLAPRAERLRQARRAEALREQLENLASASEKQTTTLPDAVQRLALGTEVSPCEPEVQSRLSAFVESIRTEHPSPSGALQGLIARLKSLSRLTERGGKTAVVGVVRHWKRTRGRHLARAEKQLGFAFAHGLPPEATTTTGERLSPGRELERWEEAAEEFLGRLLDVQDAWRQALAEHKRERRLGKLQDELRQLEGTLRQAPDQEPDRADIERDQRTLFLAAVRVREAWAVAERDHLLEALTSAIEVARSSRSLKSLMESQKGAGRWLRRLFPAWGCTLLSLGNSLPSEKDGVEWMVIDEAGQCHPAHAVSALLRAKRALVIGDVHQLEPVIGLREADEVRVLHSLAPRTSLARLSPYRVHGAAPVSIQALADRAVRKRAPLTDHFRCQPEIIAICEALCGYGLTTHTPRRSQVDRVSWLRAAVMYLPVVGVQHRFSGSWWNEEEVMATQRVVQALLALGVAPADVGIVTPYRGQLERLWRTLRDARVPAPACRLLPIKWESSGSSLFISDSKLRIALDYLADKADVVSNSWGSRPSSSWGLLTQQKIEQLASTGGRRGRGIVFLWAAGNENCPIDHSGSIEVPFTHGWSCSASGCEWVGHTSGFSKTNVFTHDFAEEPHVMLIGAVASTARRSHYSNYGTGLDLSAPSSNSHAYFRMTVAGHGITTTTGSGGDASQFVTSRFGGTSSATPLVAGIAALTLSANPELSAGDVIAILKRTASKDLDMTGYPQTPPATFDPDTSWDVSPIEPFDAGDFQDIDSDDGTWSPWFGHGLVNAEAAVQAARDPNFLTTSAGLASREGRKRTKKSRPRTKTKGRTTKAGTKRSTKKKRRAKATA